jgi:hypothetical protein
MADVLIRFGKKRKASLTRCAHLHGRSISQEVEDAIDLYLSAPVQTEQERTAVFRGLAADRMIEQLGETIADVDCELRQTKKGMCMDARLQRPEN